MNPFLRQLPEKKGLHAFPAGQYITHKANTCLLNHFKVVHFVHLFYIKVYHLLHELNAQS
jgi:hypothetical protein